MAKDPTFPFYAQDFLVDTIRWTRAMQGLHVSLIAESWANDEIIDEGGQPAGLGSTDVELWLKIKHKWELVDGKWISPKLEEVRAARLSFRQKQSKKGQLSAQKRTAVKTKYQPKVNSGSTAVEPIESESEYESEEVKKNEALTKKILYDALFDDELYVENMAKVHKGKSLHQAFEECYHHHIVTPNPPTELWEWKQKLNTWLSLSKIPTNGNRITDKKSIRRADAVIESGKEFGSFD